MSNPFSHDTTSNARTDHSFAEDQGDRHSVSFMQAMDAPRSSLSEEDYRFPDQPSSPDQSQSQPTTSTRPGYYPNGYAL